MAQRIYRESLARADAPSDLFDTIRNPHALHGNRRMEPPSPSKDQLMSEQERLNLETMERFRMLKIPDERGYFALLARLGKAAFFIVVLPPYFLLVDMPRTLLLHQLPKAFRFSKIHAIRLVAALSRTGTKLWVPLQTLAEKTLATPMRHAWQWMKDHPFYLITGRYEALKKSIGAGIDALLEKMRHSAAWMRRTGTYLFQPQKKAALDSFSALNTWGESLGALLRYYRGQATDYLKTHYLDPARSFLSTIGKKIANLTRREKSSHERAPRKEKLLAFYSQMRSKMDSGVKILASHVKTAAQNSIKRIWNQIQPVINAAETVIAFAQSIRKALQNQIAVAMEKAITRSKKHYKQLEDLLQQSLIPLSIPFALIVEYGQLWKQRLSRIASRARGGGLKKGFKKMGAFGAKTLRKATSSLKATGRALRPIFSLWLELIAILAHMLFTVIKRFTKIAYYKILRALVRLIRFKRAVVLGVRVAFAWVWVLCTYGMQEVRKLR